MSLYSFLFSSAISLLAFRSFNIVLIWSVVSENNSSVTLGAIIAIMWLFNLISLPVAGELLDSKDKKNILIKNAILPIIAIIFFYINTTQLDNNIVISALCASLLAACNSVTSSSINSMIPFIADKKSYTKSIGMATTFNSFQMIIGAILGGAFIALLGVHGAILTVASFYLIAFIFINTVTIRGTVSENQDDNKEALFQRMLVGFKVLSKLPNEKHICYTAMITNFVVTPLLTVVIPFYVVEKLNAGANTLAMFESAFAAGMLIGATLSLKIQFNVFSRLLPVIIGNILIGSGILCFVIFESTYLKILSLALSGFGLSAKGIACNSIRAFAVPDKFRARLEGAIFFLCILTIPLGSQLFGYLLSAPQAVSINTVIMIMGGIIILTSIVFITSREVQSTLKKTNGDLEDLYTKKYPEAFSR
ncbi:MFS transporter [Candidatus Sororendozoicomonas aggregata]|uniref:MFS transporter n=1 Tax=Candidatus Sororendozoicomonas aggregata TaxID=3073239 RepID=UPI002ED20431